MFGISKRLNGINTEKNWIKKFQMFSLTFKMKLLTTVKNSATSFSVLQNSTYLRVKVNRR
jgi:hypothetical protein